MSIVILEEDKWDQSIRNLYSKCNEDRGVSTTFTNTVLEKEFKEPTKTFTRQGQSLLMILENNQLVGMGCIMPFSSATAELTHICIHPDYRRRGYGKKLMTRLIAHAKALRYNNVHLTCLETNTDAIEFYNKISDLKETDREKRWSTRDQLHYTLVHYNSID